MAELVPGCRSIKPVPAALLEVLVRGLGGLRCEAVLALLFDASGSLCGYRALSDRRLAAVSGRYRDLFSHAFATGAAGFVLAHNHPSGDFRPSGADIAATRALGAMARAMEFEFLDHIIVGGACAMSMRRAGLMG